MTRHEEAFSLLCFARQDLLHVGHGSLRRQDHMFGATYVERETKGTLWNLIHRTRAQAAAVEAKAKAAAAKTTVQLHWESAATSSKQRMCIL